MSLWEWLRSLRKRPDDDPNAPLPYVDPLRAGRHPFQVYMLGLCVVSGLPYLFGQASAEAVENQLPYWLAFGWGMMLVLGASTALIGSFWKRSIADALTMERVGLSLTGGSAVVYGLCVLGGRSGVAPFYATVIYLGYWLLMVSITRFGWTESTTRRAENVLAVVGLLSIFGGGVGLLYTPANSVLVGSAIILGFGVSCLRRSRDIGRIFQRANDPAPPPVLREGDDER
jgi:hypothetical protein